MTGFFGLSVGLEARRNTSLRNAVTFYAFAALLYLAFHRQPLMTGAGWDENLFFPLALRHLEPGLFERDEFLKAIGDWYPPVFLRLLSLLCRAAEPERVMWAGSAGLLFVFGLGNLALTWRLTQNGWAALAIGVATLRPRLAPFNLYGVMLGNFAGGSIAIALAPWLLLAVIAAGDRWRRRFGAGALLGATALVNPPLPLHLALAGGAADWFGPGRPWSRLARAAALGIPTAVGVLLASSLARTGPSDPPDLEFIRWRSPYLIGRLDLVALLPASLIVPVALASAAGASFWNSELPERRFLVRFLAAIAAFWATTWLGRLWSPYILALSWRSLVWVFPVLLAAGGVFLADALRTGRRLPAAAALWLACLAATELPVSPREPLGGAGQGFCEREFLALADWARTATGKDELFLVPPDSFSPFRLYAKRAVVVTLKEGTGFYRGSVARRWWNAYRDVREAYQAGDADRIFRMARRYGAGWAVTAADLAAGGVPEYRDRCFAVWRIG